MLRRRLLPALLAVTTLAGCGQASGLGARVGAAGFGARADGGDAPATRHRGYDRDRAQRQDANDPGDAPAPRQGLLPTKVDLRGAMPPVYDQGDLGACTAFAIAKGLREHVQLRRGGGATPQSALFFYYQERLLYGGAAAAKEDTGATIADGIKVLTRTGSAPDVYWPYDVAKFAVKPPAQAYAEAPKWKLKQGYKLRNLDDMKTALSRGHAVALGFACYPQFDKIGKNGTMGMPGPKDKVDGGHAVLAVGYDDNREVLIIRNSYGPKWGDKGYFYMPYAFAADRKKVDETWCAE